MTIIGDQKHMQLEGEVAKAAASGRTRWEIPGVEGGWHVRLSKPVNLKRLRAALEMALPLAEEAGDTDVMLAGHPERWTKELAWLRGVARCDRTTPSSGAVWIITEPIKSFWVPEEFEGLAEWWGEVVETDQIRSKIRKLRATGRNDLHLGLVLHSTATAPEMSYLLGMTEQMPSESLASDISVWFVTQRIIPVLWWNAEEAQWRRFNVQWSEPAEEAQG